MNGSLVLVLASETDLDLIQEILSESARWMREEQGVLDQWPERFSDRAVLRAIRTGETFLVYRFQKCVGTVRVMETDESVWGFDDGQALYVHSLAVRRELKGQGVGEAILDAVQRQSVEQGRGLVRLDCRVTNLRLRKYYEACGFGLRGIVGQFNCYGGWEACRYQR